MANEPRVDIVAKQRSALTDAIVSELSGKFAQYCPMDDRAEFPLIGSPGLLYHKTVTFNYNIGFDGRAPETLWHKRNGEPVPSEFTKVDFGRYVTYMGLCTFGNVYADWGFEAQHHSISPLFPFTVASFGIDYKAKSVQETARVGAVLPVRLIDLTQLCLTPVQQDEFRIVPYWEGPAKVEANHFTHAEFRNLGIDGVTSVLYANRNFRL